jgi:hypothetical protein
MRTSTKVILGMALIGLWIAVGPSPVQALPSFARQTGMSCAACHTVFPELTTYGRTFKLNGYNTTNTDELKDPTEGDGGKRLEINNVPPIAAMIQVADTFTQSPPGNVANVVTPDSDKNGTLEFPSQFSLFYAGTISPKMGAFVQVTYDSGSGAFGMDNTDVRLADRFQISNTDLVLGLTLNNNPTVQDIFNTVPAWGFPYATGKSAITPSFGTQIEGLGGSVGGLGLYAFWNQLIYAEIAAYRTAPQGSGPFTNDIQGYAPYWRVALTKDFDKNSFEVGAFGINLNTYPDGSTPTGTADNVNDFGLDGQFQFIGTEHILTLKGDYIWENQNWGYGNPAGTAANATDTFTSAKVDLTYYYDRKIGATIGYMATTGSMDTMLYAVQAGNIPDSQGWIFEANYVPWYNTKFSLQYTLYNKFDGAETNYDGAGRNAQDNNTLMVMAWLMY